jgi:anti-sigma regulatory factor (Ser/Thr protein kinase)
MDDGWRKVGAGACCAWPLPADATCAGVARRVFRRTASALALDADAIDDGETMVSELAANTLHAQGGQRGEHASEVWMYLRGTGEQCELVCKVFDACPGWVRGGAPARGGRRAPADSMSGRGLEVVHELSQGHWGYHPTRARLGGWHPRGKAVWFALPAPGGCTRPAIPAAAAMARLEEELAARGFGDSMARADDPAKDTLVLSVCGDLTLCCRAGRAWLHAPGIDGQAWGFGDLAEAAEQAVAAHERLCTDAVGDVLVCPEHQVPEDVSADIGGHGRVRL